MFRGDKAGKKTETMRAPAGTARGGVARSPIEEQPNPGDDPEIHGVDPTGLHLDLMELPDQQQAQNRQKVGNDIRNMDARQKIHVDSPMECLL